jgi:hypothetical protein
MSHWIVEVETADGVLPDEAALDAVSAGLQEAPTCSECLVAYHPERQSLAVWLRVSASNAGNAAKTAESALSLALGNGHAPFSPPTKLVSVAVRLDGTEA